MNMIIGQGTVSRCDSERGEWERERGEREAGGEGRGEKRSRGEARRAKTRRRKEERREEERAGEEERDERRRGESSGGGERRRVKRRRAKRRGSRRTRRELFCAALLSPAAMVYYFRALPQLRAPLHNKIYFKTQLKETGRLHVTVYLTYPAPAPNREAPSDSRGDSKARELGRKKKYKRGGDVADRVRRVADRMSAPPTWVEEGTEKKLPHPLPWRRRLPVRDALPRRFAARIRAQELPVETEARATLGKRARFAAQLRELPPRSPVPRPVLYCRGSVQARLLETSLAGATALSRVLGGPGARLEARAPYLGRLPVCFLIGERRSVSLETRSRLDIGSIPETSRQA
ncbi:uncharacterized protein LOC116559079 [Sapajus apella]|uniref:Uncharacterized protein LOC116559079 n=1 Tax=Sapajus apella TaxID=9515 RepID=A0A6J3ITE0_SAPAP|nr:uncharacterized protein LOC116559079 [Sapajus apella]